MNACAASADAAPIMAAPMGPCGDGRFLRHPSSESSFSEEPLDSGEPLGGTDGHGDIASFESEVRFGRCEGLSTSDNRHDRHPRSGTNLALADRPPHVGGAVEDVQPVDGQALDILLDRCGDFADPGCTQEFGERAGLSNGEAQSRGAGVWVVTAVDQDIAASAPVDDHAELVAVFGVKVVSDSNAGKRSFADVHHGRIPFAHEPSRGG